MVPATQNDPRAENCRGVAAYGGQVTGVELVFRPMPSTQYELLRAELIDEAAAAGNTVANCVVLDKNGVQTGERVWLAWPWPELGAGRMLPGNPNNQHMITNGYTPPNLGPLALYVGDSEGEPISDVIGGVGLPWNRHVCFRMTWRERGTVEPEPDPETDPDNAEVVALLREIRDLVKAGFRL